MRWKKAIAAMAVSLGLVAIQSAAALAIDPGTTPAISITNTLQSAPSSSAFTASQLLVGFSTTGTVEGTNARANFPVDQFFSKITVEVTRSGTTTVFPLTTATSGGASVMSNNNNTKYILRLEGYDSAGFPGLLVGDVVTVKFAAGAFTIPDPSTNYQPYIRFDEIRTDGVNSIIQGQSQAATYAVLPNVPDVPAAPSATAGDAQATVTLTPNSSGTQVTSYRITSAPDGKYCDVIPPATSCVVTGLTNGTAYTFTVTATNAGGTSSSSSASAPVTPSGPRTLAQTGSGASPMSNLLPVGGVAVAMGFIALLITYRLRARS